MEYLFLLVNLKQRPVLVIGGGDIAVRKIITLRRSGAVVRVVANKLCVELKNMERMYDDVVWIGKKFQSSMLNDVFLIIVADNNKDVNDDIRKDAERYYKFVNFVDNPSRCSLIFPAIIDRSPVLVAISSCGKAPVLVRILREKLESLLPNFLGSIANLIGSWRKRVKDYMLDITNCRRFWEKILHNNIFNTLVAQGLLCQAERFLENALIENNHNILEKKIGNVSLVGIGPGDSGLFTLRGLQIVQEADIVLYDYLVTEEILDLVRKDAKKICVGKKGGHGKISMKQSDINQLLIKLAKEGNKVVRLKGGDPFIFGRGGEELEEVLRAGILCQVVPGVTASSVAIYSGIPLTHRDYSNSVVFITGHFFIKSCNDFDFRCFSYLHQTLVIYMGSVHVRRIRLVLLNNGYDVKIPVAVISGGTSQKQKTLIGTLDDLECLVSRSFSPSLLIIGKVVDLHHKMRWLHSESIKKYEFPSLINLF